MTQDSTSNGSGGNVRRRRFLQGAGASSVALIAGCAGSGDGGDTGNGNTDGGDTETDGGGSGGTTTGSTGPKYEGLTIRYWNRFHNNSGRASESIKNAISRFEDETGATVEVNYSAGDPGQRWLTLAREGERPHIMDQVSGFVGPFVELGIAKPFPEYRDLFSDELLDRTSWLMDPLGEQAYGGYDGIAHEFKFSSEPPRLFLARRDHLEAAGLDPESDFPPTDFEDSVRIAEALQADGPGKYGWQIYGSSGDVTDTCTEDWPVAQAGQEGKILNQDWTDTQIDGEPIKTTYENFVSLHVEHELSSPGTVSMSDEDGTQLLIRGEASMTQVPAATYADLLANAEDQVMNGDFVFGPAWKGESGSRGITGGDGVVFINPPDGADEAQWDRAHEAAADLLENYLYHSMEFQRTMFSTIGGANIRDDVTPEDIRAAVDDPAGYDQTQIIEATNTCITDQEGYYIQEAAPFFGQIQGEIMPGYIQQALQGQITASEALDRAAQEARDQFF
ncbi:extracellular solute-binding protein [Halogeometricum sp. S1BR25-6]|uniref:Extracellular solute-binding protein n=1 Tax=Halogeometricum salsisoli TaxID=2950536 RepID=A0ABU2GIU0_9EURY|nr:extracellular solute-binding protein [Halogeometricum sp. S1BR25-6]MDS0300178.1 extracellular solute-binding protein [Halogeometricum sp. S1BR25-6]